MNQEQEVSLDIQIRRICSENVLLCYSNVTDAGIFCLFCLILSVFFVFFVFSPKSVKIPEFKSTLRIISCHIFWNPGRLTGPQKGRRDAPASCASGTESQGQHDEDLPEATKRDCCFMSARVRVPGRLRRVHRPA